MFKFCFDGLARTKDVHLDLTLTDAHHLGHFFVAFPLEVAQLDTGALLLRQGVDDLPDEADAVALVRLLERIVLVGSLGSHSRIVERGVMAAFPLGEVD